LNLLKAQFMKYDFLVAVIRDRPDATSLNSWIFLTGASVMFLIGLMVLLKRNEQVKNRQEA